MITYNAEGIAMPKIKKRLTSKWIKAVAASHGRKVGEVGYLFVNDDKILEVNREYLGHDYYTDIITFDYDEDDVINGDLVISLDTVRTNAEQFGKSYDDELHRVIIHGILHLCASTTRVLASARSWRPTRIAPWICWPRSEASSAPLWAHSDRKRALEE